MEFVELKSELDDGKFRRVYIFAGEEREVMRRYIKRIAGDGSLVNGETLEGLIPTLTSKGLFSTSQTDRRTFVIEGDKQVFNVGYQRLYQLAGKNTLIFIYDAFDFRATFFKEHKKLCVEFKRFTPEQLVDFVSGLLDDKASDQLAYGIAQYCGCDVARIELECDKINQWYFDIPWATEVLASDVMDLIQPPAEDRIFEMVDASLTRKADKAWSFYQDLLELGESPIKIIAVLYLKVKQTFLVQVMYNLPNHEIVTKTGLTPFQVQKARETAVEGDWTPESYLEILQEIQRTEMDMKSGRVDIQLGMDRLMIDILS